MQAGHYDFFGPSLCNLYLGGSCTTNFLNVDDSAYGPARIRLTMFGGGDFDLLSLNVLESYQYTSQFTACGTNCTVTSSNGGSMSLLSQQVMNFSGAAWTNLSWIEFFTASSGPPTIASAAIDDINVVPSAVPAPAAGWLLATGLACMFGWQLRKSA